MPIVKKAAKASKRSSRPKISKSRSRIGTYFIVSNSEGSDDKKNVIITAKFANLALDKRIGDLPKGSQAQQLTIGTQAAMTFSIAWIDSAGLPRRINFPSDGRLHSSINVQWKYYLRTENLDVVWQ